MLSGGRLEYTKEEWALIAASKAPDEEGMPKRAIVNDLVGRSYTMAGLNRGKHDFTVPANFPLSKFSRSDFHPRWIRKPDFHDPPDTICDEWYVFESRKGYLVHQNASHIRPHDTIGMYATLEQPGMMTLVFDSRTPEEICEEANILALKHPGMLPDLDDDIPLGMSPRAIAESEEQVPTGFMQRKRAKHLEDYEEGDAAGPRRL